MRLSRIGLLILAFLAAEPVKAGIYNPGESEEVATYPDFLSGPQGKNFYDVVVILRSISANQIQFDNPVRRRYIFQEELIGKSATSNLKPEDLLQGSAVLIRRRKFKDAELLLRRIAVLPEERDNIPIQSNFATALHMAGDLQGAYETLRPVVRDAWQPSWGELPEPRRVFLQRIGWSEPVYDLNRKYDTYYLKLLRLRLRERVTKKEGKGLVQLPDALFDDGKDPPSPVRFVNNTGEFEAGSIAAAERAKLPTEALAMVQQLVVWMPDDLRLYWLLGELYNAEKPPTGKENRAGVRAALKIFQDLSTVTPVADDVRDQLRKRVSALREAQDRFDSDDADKLAKDLRNVEKASTDGTGFTVDWRTVAISFAVGFVLAFFVLWQMREIQRRRLARHNAAKAR